MASNPSHSIAKKSLPLFHLLAFITIGIWGVTFVSTKILISVGLSPTEIFVYRFLIAYVCAAIAWHKRLWANSIKDEVLLCAAGLCGGSLYFISENSALQITLASDVSLLICTAPLFTMLLGFLILHIPLNNKMLIGSIIAMCGVGVVVFNGSLKFGINPLGDILTLLAAMSWAFYCTILKILGPRYSTGFITRKVFFYGLLSVGAYLLFVPTPFNTGLLLRPVVVGNLLFLGLIASMLCYTMWNSAVMVLGAEKTANYIYCTPVITVIASTAFLSEPLTIYTVAGTILIIGGVYLAERK